MKREPTHDWWPEPEPAPRITPHEITLMMQREIARQLGDTDHEATIYFDDMLASNQQRYIEQAAQLMRDVAFTKARELAANAYPKQPWVTFKEETRDHFLNQAVKGMQDKWMSEHCPSCGSLSRAQARFTRLVCKACGADW